MSSTRCYRLVFRKGTTWDQSTHETRCPEGEPVALPDVVEPRRLPDGALDTVKATLAPMAGAGVDAAQVKAVLEAALPGVAIDVATQADLIGVAGLVAGPMLRDCVYARLSPAGVEAWVPPHVYEQAGETSCTGGEAFSDFTRHAPH